MEGNIREMKNNETVWWEKNVSDLAQRNHQASRRRFRRRCPGRLSLSGPLGESVGAVDGGILIGIYGILGLLFSSVKQE